METSVEHSLDLIAVEYDPLGLAALVFVVEGDGFPGRCAEQQRLYKPWKLLCSRLPINVGDDSKPINNVSCQGGDGAHG